MRLWKLFLFGSVLAVVPPVVVLVAFEASLRLAGVGQSARFWEVEELDGERFYTPNPHFTRLFFPEAMKRLFVPFRVRVEKDPREYRVFVLGGSAVNGDPDYHFSIPVILQEQLRRVQPEREIVVVNAALTACNSFVAREIARDLARFEPDMVVVYMGNNEVIGPFGPSNRLSSGALGAALPGVQLVLRRTRLGQVLGSLRERSIDGDDEVGWRGMEHFLDQRLGPDDPRLQSVYRHYRRNLEAIVDFSHRAGAAVILSTVAVNLQHQPPFIPLSEDFSRAEALLQAGDQAGAAAAFARACDHDGLRFRADSRINAIIREVADAADPALTAMLDAEGLLRSPAGDLPAGFDAFYEHVHFNIRGAYLVASALAREIVEIDERAFGSALDDGWLDFDSVQAAIAYNEYDLWRILVDLRRRFEAAPFTLIEDWDERTAWMRALEDQVRRSISQAETKTRIHAQLVAALRERPDDAFLQFRLARFLAGNQQITAALPLFRSAYRIHPRDPTFIEGFVNAAVSTRDWAALAEPVENLRGAVPRHPRLLYYEAAVRMDPSHPEHPAPLLDAYLERQPRDSDALALRALLEEASR